MFNPRRVLAGTLALLMVGAGLAMAAPAAADETVPASAFTYSEGWLDGANGEKATTQAGATATLSFDVTGTDGRIAIRGLKTPWSGKASVRIDAGTTVVKDLYAPASTSAEWYVSPLLPKGRHSVTVTALGTKRSASADTWVSILSARLVRATVGTTTPPPPPPPPPPPGPVTGLPYGTDSFFQSRADTLPVDAARTQQFHQFMATHPDQASITWPKVNMNADWAMSYDYGTADDPVWYLTGGNTTHAKLAHLRPGGVGFRMSDSMASTFPTGNQDRPGVVFDTVNGYTVQFADAVPNLATRTITVSNAGILYHSSNGLDYRNPRSDDQRNFTSRGRILDSMIVTREELDRAVAANTGVGHVLHVYFVETNTADGFVHPMVGAEGSKAGFGAEGERFRIKPTVDLVARGLTGHALALARTLQEHGGYLGDNSGSSTQLKLSQADKYTGTNLTTDVFRGKLTWTDFEMVVRGTQ